MLAYCAWQKKKLIFKIQSSLYWSMLTSISLMSGLVLRFSGYYDTDDDYNLTVRLVSGILTTGLHILIFWFSSDSDGSDGLFWYILICCDFLIFMNNVWHLWNIQTGFILFYSHTKLCRVCAIICLISWFLETYGLNQFSNFRFFFEKKKIPCYYSWCRSRIGNSVVNYYSLKICLLIEYDLLSNRPWLLISCHQ